MEIDKPRVFVDADVLFAGSAAPRQHGASLVILKMAEITLIDAVASPQVLDEAERNLAGKLPAALAAAVREQCDWLVTFNGRHFQPGHPDVTVVTPGQLILRVRDLLAHLTGRG